MSYNLFAQDIQRAMITHTPNFSVIIKQANVLCSYITNGVNSLVSQLYLECWSEKYFRQTNVSVMEPLFFKSPMTILCHMIPDLFLELHYYWSHFTLA